MNPLSSIWLYALAVVQYMFMAPNHDYTTSEAGNPFVDGWYADPDAAFYNNEYWVYPTSSYPYEQQTYLDAFSSPDLVHWTKHPDIITTADISWAHKALWAPATISRDGKYYLYFAANDIQSNAELGGIGVAVADRPEGPYRDAIGKPLIDAFHNGAQPIDQSVFIDDDGQAYIYYGGWSHCNVARLNPDMISLGTFPDGSVYKEVTPSRFVEGALMFKRRGRYYFMWSEGSWTGPDYAVSYAIADSPVGPFERVGVILEQDPAVATGSGHNGVICVPGGADDDDDDTYYIVYHRHPLGDPDGNHRELAYDRLYFEANGTIRPVRMLVRDNFADGNMIGWRALGGGQWDVVDGQLRGRGVGKAVLNTNFTDLVMDADVTLTAEGGGGADAGVLFRASRLGDGGPDEYSGYYTGVRASGHVVLGLAAWNGTGDGSWTGLGTADAGVEVGMRSRVRVRAVGRRISVYVDDMETAKLEVSDATYANGTNGVMVSEGSALFGRISVDRA